MRKWCSGPLLWLAATAAAGPGAGSSRPDAPGEEAGAGAGVRVGDSVCGAIECWTGGGPVRPGLRAPAALGSPGRGAGGCGRPVGWAERGLEGAGAL